MTNQETLARWIGWTWDEETATSPDKGRHARRVQVTKEDFTCTFRDVPLASILPNFEGSMDAAWQLVDHGMLDQFSLHNTTAGWFASCKEAGDYGATPCAAICTVALRLAGVPQT